MGHCRHGRPAGLQNNSHQCTHHLLCQPMISCLVELVFQGVKGAIFGLTSGWGTHCSAVGDSGG